MACRPPQLCNLQTGQLIDTQQNFAATFNWLVSAVKNLTGGEGCTVDWPRDDQPTINCLNEGNIGDGGGGGGGFEYTFQSTSDSNVTATVTDQADGKKLVTLGVYYI